MIPEFENKIEKVLLVGLARNSRQRSQVESSLEELKQLALSAGVDVLASKLQVRTRPDPALFVGRGFVAQLKDQLNELGGNSVIFDDLLSPAQQRNLEQALETKVIDRATLILDIFATRARTAAARLQVELAQLEYTLPRLVGAWVHFSRQYGGIGAKGPGETQLEIDRRRVRVRIAHLKKKLVQLDRQRQTQRKSRQTLFKIALVGYTNAGKSTLFNLLTKSSVTTANSLFTTLDATTRVMSSPYPCRVVFSDTVGFIKKLPHQLVESFKSTLEEVRLADLLLHIIDSSDRDFQQRYDQTRQVLEEIGAVSIPYLLIINKIDLNPDFVFAAGDGIKSLRLSAVTGKGLSSLQAEIIIRSNGFVSARNAR